MNCGQEQLNTSQLLFTSRLENNRNITVDRRANCSQTTRERGVGGSSEAASNRQVNEGGQWEC